MKKCFESRDVKMLQEAITKMPEVEAKYHMKRCIDSGLWLPDGGSKNDESQDDADKDSKEPIYEPSPASTAAKARDDDLD